MKLIKLRIREQLKLLDLDNVSHILRDEHTTEIHLKKHSDPNRSYLYIDAPIEVVIQSIENGIKEGYVE